MRTGIFGGTFDPIHVGHLAVAASVHAALSLDRTLLLVANQPWQKAAEPITPAPLRFDMAAAAVADLEVPGIEASDSEIRRGGPSYTIDTIEALLADDPAADLFLIVGYDVASMLDSWHRYDELRQLVTLAVVRRPSVAAKQPPGWRIEAVEVPQLEVSSTDIRRRLAAGLPVDGLVPAAAMRIFRASGGYPERR